MPRPHNRRSATRHDQLTSCSGFANYLSPARRHSPPRPRMEKAMRVDREQSANPIRSSTTTGIRLQLDPPSTPWPSPSWPDRRAAARDGAYDDPEQALPGSAVSPPSLPPTPARRAAADSVRLGVVILRAAKAWRGALLPSLGPPRMAMPRSWASPDQLLERAAGRRRHPIKRCAPAGAGGPPLRLGTPAAAIDSWVTPQIALYPVSGLLRPAFPSSSSRYSTKSGLGSGLIVVKSGGHPHRSSVTVPPASSYRRLL